MVSFKVCEAHLNLLSFVARFEEGLCFHFPPRNVTRILVDTAHEPARRLLRATLGLKHASPAIEIGSKIAYGKITMDTPGRAQLLACRADVNVPSLVEDEVSPGERPVFP